MLIQTAPPRETISQDAGYLRAKRFMDVVITLLLLPFCLIVMGIVAICIRLDSPGPILFRQKRVGHNGVEFEFLKFRSMYTNTSEATHREAIQRYMKGHELNGQDNAVDRYKLGNDARITRVGRFIRRTSLDELPQFFNILRGDMSLVGPRPALPYEVQMYSIHDRQRLAGKPGLTGPWQVYGRSRVPFAKMVEMDIAYLERQSLREDLKLVVLTVPVMLSARGGG
jgi:lipopolysaccharide/colanic/teichoic acid biosynthesis glycosyltransferase